MLGLGFQDENVNKTPSDVFYGYRFWFRGYFHYELTLCREIQCQIQFSAYKAGSLNTILNTVGFFKPNSWFFLIYCSRNIWSNFANG